MTETSIAEKLKTHFEQRRGAIYTIRNVYFFDPKIENDFLAVTFGRQIIEVEIKVSKWDYQNDFLKKEKHDRLASASCISRIPNMFYYALPERLINYFDVPDYAGLYEIGKDGNVRMKKTARILHHERMDSGLWERMALKAYNKL